MMAKKVPINNSTPGKVLSTNPVTCYNRYAVFQQGDSVVSQSLANDTVNPVSDQKFESTNSISTAKVNSNSNVKEASYNDVHKKGKQNGGTTVKLHISDEDFICGHSDMNSTSKYDLPLRLRDKKM